MTDVRDITPEQRQDILRRLDKLLRTKGTTEAESAARIAKAQELLAQYNLTMDDVEREGGDGGRRAEEKFQGGFYEWERNLWAKVGDLNFCWVIPWYEWRVYEWTDRQGRRREKDWRMHQHRVIGRQINIAQTKAMASYLVDVTNRLCKERLHGDSRQALSSWAVSFREGVAARIIEKLEDRRQQVLSEERERERAAAKMAMQGASTATGLTLAKLSKQEQDANADFVLGEGWSAKQAAKRAEKAAWRQMDEQQRTAWAAENPEKARQFAEEARKARRSAAQWRGGSERREKDWGAYSAGYEAGADVGIDTQAEGTKVSGRLK